MCIERLAMTIDKNTLDVIDNCEKMGELTLRPSRRVTVVVYSA